MDLPGFYTHSTAFRKHYVFGMELYILNGLDHVSDGEACFGYSAF